MESESSWEYKTLIDELIQGMEKAQQLGAHLSSLSSSESQDLLQKITSSYEKALVILKWSGSVGESQCAAPISGAPDSSLSVNGSPRSEDFNKAIKDQQNYANISKKRKMLPTWTDQVRVSPDNGLEGPGEDGYSWRKYGQKDILGAKYPRSYYRCTFRQMRNCWATKQVQRSDEDPSVFEITYRGTHTCNLAPKSAPAPPSPEKQELKHSYDHDSHQLIQPNQMLMNLRASLRVKTDNLEAIEKAFPLAFPPTFTGTGESQEYTLPVLGDDSFLGTYNPSFLSPATPESNYFSPSPCQMNRVSEPADIFSANTSSTNSPIMGMDFSIEHVSLDPCFPFDTPGFFTPSC